MTNPYLLGVTGGIGSGKSVVCKVLQTMTIPTYDADSRAKTLMQESEMLRKGLVQAFGPNSYKDGQLNRAWLAQAVFNDEEKLQKLNELVHPAVKKDFEEWVKQHQQHKILAKEAALLFEAGSYKELDKTLLVTAPEELRIKRVLARDPQRTIEQVQAIISKQWTYKKKVELADFVVHNDESQLLIPQVLEVLKEIRK